MTRTLTCHTDGASRGNPGPAAAGVVVLDDRGRERRAVSVFLGVTTNNAAEYLALHEALKAAADVCREDGLDPASVSVVIRTDSQLVARQVSGEYRMKSPDLLPLLEEFRRLARAFGRVEVTYLPREKNRRADALASEALDGPGGNGGGGPPVGRGRDSGSGPRRGRSADTGGGRRAPFSRLTHLECSRCGHRHEPSGPPGPCGSCGGPLLARYDLRGLEWPPESEVRPESASLWRYHELLPVESPEKVVSLGEGLTPLVPLARPPASPEGGAALPPVFLKDEGRNPTGTFKARGASVAVSRLLELGVDRCALPTAGNAGSAFAAYCARAGIGLLAVMPEDAPAAVRAECEAYGAEVRLVPGLLPDAARHAAEAVRRGREGGGEAWSLAATFAEPFRLEGKKTIAFELFEAFGGRFPDALVCPVGGGVALVGAWKAASELIAAGLTAKAPRLFAVQAAGCAPVVRAFDAGHEETRPFAGARTVAAGLRVPEPAGGFLVLRALRSTGGGAVAVTDENILRTAGELRRTEGLDLGPEAVAAVAALPELGRRGWLLGCREVVVLATGSGLKSRGS